MSEPDFFTKAQWAMQEAMDRIGAAIQTRQRELMKMPWPQLRALANDANLPQDLRRTDLVKYIIKKEFASR